jgi:hypothetical protein
MQKDLQLQARPTKSNQGPGSPVNLLSPENRIAEGMQKLDMTSALANLKVNSNF